MTLPTTTLDAPAAETSADVFKRHLSGVAYADVPGLRAELLEFLDNRSTPKAQAGMLALTVTEILTNLAKHPPEKATYIEVKLRLAPRNTYIDISDNSTPFAEFDAKCKSALSRLDAAQGLAEGGYGLGVILKQHRHVTYTPMGKSPDGFNHFRVRDTQNTETPRLRLFLVDDDPVALKRHGAMLEELYEVVAFNRAEDAVTAFTQQKPAIVVSDLNMPGMDGLALRRALSELDGGNATPFVFLSAQTASENSPYISELGVDDFLCKPVLQARLQNVVARLLTRSTQVRLSLEGKFQQHLTSMLKPELPDTYGGWRIVTKSEMAEAGGGDFTLYHETPTHMLAVLADVMGHGPQAKFFSYAYAGYLRSLFRLQAAASDPAQFLKALSASIEGDTFLESIILTCQSFQLFPRGKIAIASAGHPAPMLVRAGTVETLDIAGPLPALASEAGYNLSTLDLSDGGKIIFATDGFLQAFGDEGKKRPALLKLLAATAQSPAAETAEALWRAYAAQQQARPKDDATLIIAEYGGPL